MSKQKIKDAIKTAVENDSHKNDIRKISLFGSYLHGSPKQDSDIDILIEFETNATIGFFKLAQIKRNMEKYTKKEIDLLTPEALSDFIRDEITSKAETIYEK